MAKVIKKKVDKNSIHYKGGMAVKEKYGNQHYKDMVNKRWEKQRALKENK